MTISVEMSAAPDLLGLDRKELITARPLAAWDTERKDWFHLHVTYNTRSGAVGVVFVTITDGFGYMQTPLERVTDSDGEVVKIGRADGIPRKLSLLLKIVGVGDVPVEVSTRQGFWIVQRM